jgi:hypothetical protein
MIPQDQPAKSHRYTQMKRQRSFFKVFGAPAIAGLAIIPTVIIAFHAIVHGHGSGFYRNVYGLEIPYKSVLVLIDALIATAVIAYLARLFYFWRSSHDRAAKLHVIRRNPARDEK